MGRGVGRTVVPVSLLLVGSLSSFILLSSDISASNFVFQAKKFSKVTFIPSNFF